MVLDIQSKGILDRMHADTKSQPYTELPRELGKQILPVLEVNPHPVIREIVDVGLNDSDKTFTVPKGKQWKFLYGHFVFAATATVGNRRLVFRVTNANGDTMFESFAQALQTANSTDDYSLSQYGAVIESPTNHHEFPIPVNLILNENFLVRILDLTAVDVEADDLTIRFVVEETEFRDVN